MINTLKVFFALIAQIFVFSSVVQAQNVVSPLVRVKLSRFFPPLTPTVYITSTDSFIVTNDSGAVAVQAPPGSTYEFSTAEDGHVLVSTPGMTDDSENSESGASAEGLYFTVSVPTGSTFGLSTDPQSSFHSYRGDLVVSPGISLVNVIDLEDYLKGVLQPEIGGHAPIDALCAQAIASRTYALHNLGKMALAGADMDDTTRTQSYIGVAGESPTVDAAVANTQGQVLTFEGQLIDAVFSTDCGGVTGDGGLSRPYLTPVSDPSCSVETGWQALVNQSDISVLLGVQIDSADSAFGLSIRSQDRSGRATILNISYGAVQKQISGEMFRRKLGYDRIRSALFKIKKLSSTSYEIDGKGWGHGLGMCQKGAIYLAQHSEGYIDILKHYYSGAQVAQLTSSMITQPNAGTMVIAPTPQSSQPYP